MNRVTLGLAAVLLLAIGCIVAVQQPEGGAAFAGACVRVGLVLGAIWLALPQVTRFWQQTPKWLLVAAGVALVVCVIHPLYALAAVPVLALLWFLGPKLTPLWKSKPRQQNSDSPKPAPSIQAPTASAPVKSPRRRSNAR